MSAPIQNRYDFMLIFDVRDGNPNGDPDAGNLPRVDPETGEGLITDVCLKRKVRNYVQLVQTEDGKANAGFDIYVKEKAVLNNEIQKAYDELGIDLKKEPVASADGKKRKKEGTGQGGEIQKACKLMCQKYFDIRTFGAVMSTGANAGQVRGPVQLTFARSVDPIVTLEHAITRMAITTEEKSEEQGGDNRTMGRKNTVPYGLYVAYGFISPAFARQTGFSEEDLGLLWESFAWMFEQDHSAARGRMAMRKILVFKHESALGNAHSDDLFDLVQIKRRDDGSEGESPAPRKFADYRVTLAGKELPCDGRPSVDADFGEDKEHTITLPKGVTLLTNNDLSKNMDKNGEENGEKDKNGGEAK